MQPEVYYFLILKYYFTNIAHSFQDSKTWSPLRDSHQQWVWGTKKKTQNVNTDQILKYRISRGKALTDKNCYT